MVGMGTPDPTKSAGRHELGRATWTEVDRTTARVLLVPVGSCEQHGPHLPMDTDTTLATAVAQAVAATRDDVWVAPPVAYGSSGEHQAFPGTLSIGTAALTTVLVELARSALPPPGSGSSPDPDLAARWDHVVFVNGHGGNLEAVGAAVDLLVGEGRAVSAWSPQVPGGDAHAGRTETSLLLAIDPDVVGDGRPVGVTTPLERLLPRLRDGGVAAVSEDGVLGDATGASAEEGMAILADLVTDLASRLSPGPAPRPGAS